MIENENNINIINIDLHNDDIITSLSYSYVYWKRYNASKQKLDKTKISNCIEGILKWYYKYIFNEK
ncbi:MAG: hypothetical protein SCARUB_03426 [Candidatus Scalindua rubra]|uniref:Uncharacterized protein n=1 Tax=Candidatus Scalindua rubra TaxID=1872076 RepID=A0A1E3X7D2_9BACT|nr:MAG: hypothetical protein SCARUB_03426 [Candidatus Scalindua rubra]